VWTWNAIGKADSAWQLAPGADEARKGFLLNHLISDVLPLVSRDAGSATAGSPASMSATVTATPSVAAATISNSDPVTGQAGWYDVRVRLYPAEPEEPAETFPQMQAVPAPPGVRGSASRVLNYFAGRAGKAR
jgi:hypothetical protein